MIVYNNQAPKNVNNVGQFGATEGSIGAYKSAAAYAADAKYWALLSQKSYDSMDGVLKEVERLFKEGTLLEEDIEDLKRDFENQNQILTGLIQQTGEAIDNINTATENANQAVRDVLAQLDKISDMSVVVSTLPPGTPATGSFDNETGVFSFDIPEGLPGKDGTDGSISDIGDVAIGTPVPDDYGFFVDKTDGGLYRTPMSEIAKLVPSVNSFNGRVGQVVPATGDYTVSQVTGAAASGANSDITSITGLTTALSVAQGGTGATSIEGARSNLGVSRIKNNTSQTTIGSADGRTLLTVTDDPENWGVVWWNGSSYETKPLSVGKGGTGAVDAAGARMSLVAAKSGDNSDITSMTNKVTFTQSPVVPDAVDDSDAVTLRQLRNSSDSDGILANKQAVARYFGVKQSEVVYFSVGAVLSGYKIIYDKESQKSYSLPDDLGSGVTATSLSTAGILVHSAGNVDLGALAVAREEYVTLPGSFATGVTVNTKNELVVFTDGKYRWDGPLPKTVPTGSTPETSGGIGTGAWLSVGDAALRSELLSVNGAVIQSFNSVSDMKSYNITAGRTYYTKGYWAAGDGGGATYYTTAATGTAPNGYSDHVATNGVYIRLLSDPTELNHGVKVSPLYVPADARWNRNAVQAMCRDTRWSTFRCVAQGTWYLLGSANIGRDNVTLIIEKGCYIRGRYTDPTIPTPDQGGHMIGFAHFFDPDNGDFIPWRDGDTRVNAPIRNVTVIVDGDVMTEYNAVHINPYNNNCIGFLKGINCKIIGSGGSSGSDHRAFNFDGIDTNAPNGAENRGGSINCHIDVGYVYNCVDNPVMIAADQFTPSYNSIRVGSVRRMLTGGYNNPIVANVSGSAHFDVFIGQFLQDGGTSPALVSARGVRSCNVGGGVISGCTSVLYSVDSFDLSISVREIFNTPIGIAVAGSSSVRPRNVTIKGIEAVNASFVSAYAQQNPNAGPVALVIEDNNFTAAASTFKFFVGKTAATTPTRQLIRDNGMSSTGDGGSELNYLTGGSKFIATGNTTTTSLPVNFKDGNWNFTKATVVVGQGGGRGIATIDLLAKIVTSNSMVIKAGAYDVTVALPAGGNTLTVSVVSPNFIDYVMLHN